MIFAVVDTWYDLHISSGNKEKIHVFLITGDNGVQDGGMQLQCME